MSRTFLKLYGEKFVAEANKKLNENQKITLSFSNGWYSRFSSCFGLTRGQVHEGSGSTDLNAIKEDIPRIFAEIEKYLDSDVLLPMCLASFIDSLQIRL